MKKHAKYLALAATLAIMAVIFFFSAQPAGDSYKLSEVLVLTVEEKHQQALLPSWFDTQNFHANLRKWAHVYIYCALGVSVAATVHLWTRKINLRQQALLASAVCMLYAAGDELHQFFVPGRAMLLGDVAIDALGFLPCIAVVYLWLWARKKH